MWLSEGTICTLEFDKALSIHRPQWWFRLAALDYLETTQAASLQQILYLHRADCKEDSPGYYFAID